MQLSITPTLAVESIAAILSAMNHRGTPEDLSFTRLRELAVEAPTHAERGAHVSAASGLVCIGDLLYVVADDELHLGVFRLHDSAPGELVQLRKDPLSSEAKARKAAKPDFEALVHVRAGDDRHGLLALGSGSTERRMQACWIALDPTGRIAAEPRTIELAPLYAEIARVIGEVNIEGACICRGDLLLFQRGNRRSINNAVLAFDLHTIFDALDAGGMACEPQPNSIRQYDLGSIEGVPLAFSDAVTLSDRSILFAAVAEDTRDAYNDGRNLGSAIGMLDPAGELRFVRRVREAFKIEGVHAQESGDRLDLLAVTDADDPAQPAVLLSAQLRR